MLCVVLHNRLYLSRHLGIWSRKDQIYLCNYVLIFSKLKQVELSFSHDCIVWMYRFICNKAHQNAKRPFRLSSPYWVGLYWGVPGTADFWSLTLCSQLPVKEQCSDFSRPNSVSSWELRRLETSTLMHVPLLEFSYCTTQLTVDGNSTR